MGVSLNPSTAKQMLKSPSLPPVLASSALGTPSTGPADILAAFELLMCLQKQMLLICKASLNFSWGAATFGVVSNQLLSSFEHFCLLFFISFFMFFFFFFFPPGHFCQFLYHPLPIHLAMPTFSALLPPSLPCSSSRGT